MYFEVVDFALGSYFFMPESLFSELLLLSVRLAVVFMGCTLSIIAEKDNLADFCSYEKSLALQQFSTLLAIAARLLIHSVDFSKFKISKT